MRAPQNEATGTSGESEVLSQFQRLGWAGIQDTRHDTGTDLYLRPRDTRRFELGAVMGAQIKTGPSYFSSPEKDDKGEVSGWWFKESNRDHFDFWIDHALPHILVLRNQENDCSYWVHITPENVQSTGKGAKILVPLSQLVNKEYNDALSDVALTQLPTPTWDGTAWTGAVHLSPRDELRHALIAPRLVAPNPNLIPSSITAVEALAMQVLIRHDLETILEPEPLRSQLGFSEETVGLSLEEALQSDEWGWRATAALHLWLYKGDETPLQELIERASVPSERAAAAVINAVYCFDENNPDVALEVITCALQHDDYAPVDYAWLKAQKARALLEIGRHEDAFDLALATQRIHREYPSDVTAGGIAGACALISFRAAGWMRGNAANFIEKSDNTINWWQSQITSYGLYAHLSDSFSRWTESGNSTYGNSDTARNRLVSARLLASFVADQDGWSTATSSLAQHLLVASSPQDEPDNVANLLTNLRRSGDYKKTSQAVKKVMTEGPILAAHIAVNEVNLNKSTRTSASADIDLIIAAGDVLEQEHADKICNWALTTLGNSENYLTRVRPNFNVFDKITRLLRAIIPALSSSALDNLIEFLFSLPAVIDDRQAQTLATLVNSLPEEIWNEETRSRAADRTQMDTGYLQEAYLAVSAPTVEESSNEILRRAEMGDLRVLLAITDLKVLPQNAVSVLQEKLRDAVKKLIKNAREGSFPEGGIDVGAGLTYLNIFHPLEAYWEPIEDMWGNPVVRSSHKERSLKVVAQEGDSLSLKIKERLARHLRILKDQEPLLLFPGEYSVSHYAAEALAVLIDEEERKQLVRALLAGDSLHRASSAHVIRRFGDPAESEIFLALSHDSNPMVRNAALGGLAALTKQGKVSQRVHELLLQSLEQGGRNSALAVVSQLGRKPDNPERAQLISIAAAHSSAQVRKIIGFS